MPVRPAPSTHAEHIASSDARNAVVAVLRRRRIAPNEIDDLTQDVLTRALLVDPPPPTLQQCIGLLRKMAQQAAIDSIRQRASRGRFDAGPSERADEHPAAGTDSATDHPVQRQRRLALVRSQIESGAITTRQASMLAMVADGASRAEIAEHFAVAEQTVKNELAVARKTAQDSWRLRASAGLIAIAAIAAALAFWLTPRTRMAGEIGPDGDTARTRHDDPRDQGRLIRKKALDDCNAHAWGDCLAGLDTAAELDPDGDRDEAVQRARTEMNAGRPRIDGGLNLDAKPQLGGAGRRHPSPAANTSADGG
jgi:DNA-directed RNA polymerase specialized sigma24 family protein